MPRARARGRAERSRASAARTVATSVAPLPGGREQRLEPELAGLGDPPLGMADPAELAGQAELAEGRRAARLRWGPSATPRAALATASATARSAPGSSTRTPPTTLTNTSAPPSGCRRGESAPRARARAGCGRARCTTRRGGTSSEGVTSAWTSTSSGRDPSIAASTTLPEAPRRPLRRSARRRRAPRPARRGASRRRPPRWSSRSGSWSRGACGSCARAHPRTRARSRRGARARADRQAPRPWSRGRPAAPRSARAWRRATIRAATSRTWPTDPGGGRELARVECLHRVDHADLRPLALERRDHGLEVGLGDRRHRERRAGEPRRAQRDLRGRLLAGDVERAVAGAARLPSTMFVSVDLPIPGAPPSSTTDPGTMPPPSTRSSSPIPVAGAGPRAR